MYVRGLVKLGGRAFIENICSAVEKGHAPFPTRNSMQFGHKQTDTRHAASRPGTMNLKDKNALITGGGTGVGRAITLMLAQLGASVAVNFSKSQPDAEATVADAKHLDVRAMVVQA